MQSLLGETVLSKTGSVKLQDLSPAPSVYGLYFSGSWCGPCQKFTPSLVKAYNEIKSNGKNFEIIYVPSDRAQSGFDEYYAKMPWLALPFGDRRKDVLSMLFGVSGIPTLIILNKDGSLVSAQGRADVMNHGAKAFDKWTSVGKEEKSDSVQSLEHLIDMSQTQCLNQSAAHPLKDMFAKGANKYLESDADEQLLITVSFKNEVSMRSIIMKSVKDGRAPKGIKIYLNNTHMDFNDTESETVAQDFTLAVKDYKDAEDGSKDQIQTELVLKAGKYKKVRSIVVFATGNIGGKDTTVITDMTFTPGLEGLKKEEDLKFDLKELKPIGEH